MKKAQSDNTRPFWYTHKQTPTYITRKPRTAIYKEFLAQKTIHIHAENTPLVNKLTSYSPPPLPGPLPCAPYLIISVAVLLTPFPSSFPCV